MTGLQKSSDQSYNLELLPQALQSKKLTEVGMIDLQALTLWICLQLGMSEQDDLQLISVAKYLRENQSRKKLDEIKIAVNLFCSGEFEVMESRKIISARLVGQILKGYETIKGKELTRLRKIANKEPERRNITATPEQEKRDFEYIEQYIQEHNSIPNIAHFLNAFSYMERESILNQRNDQKEAFKRQVITQLRTEATGAGIMASLAKIALQDDRLIKTECRRRTVIQHFKTQIK